MTSSLQIEICVYFFYNLNSNAIIISNGMVAALLLKVHLSVFRLLVRLGSTAYYFMEDINVDITIHVVLELFCGEELC